MPLRITPSTLARLNLDLTQVVITSTCSGCGEIYHMPGAATPVGVRVIAGDLYVVSRVSGPRVSNRTILCGVDLQTSTVDEDGVGRIECRSPVCLRCLSSAALSQGRLDM